MSVPEIKICGLRREVDAAAAIEAGAGWLGVVVASRSPRAASFEEIAAIAALCAEAGRVRLVLVARAESLEPLLDVARGLAARPVATDGRLYAQVHGGTASFDLPQIEVLRVDAGARHLPVGTTARDARAPSLFDCGEGGTGRRWPWALLAPRAPAHCFVAGGIAPDNIEELMRYEPWGMDVSSGIEVSPGIKDHGALRSLFDGVVAARRLS